MDEIEEGQLSEECSEFTDEDTEEESEFNIGTVLPYDIEYRMGMPIATGEQYLASVRLERDALPRVVSDLKVSRHESSIKDIITGQKLPKLNESLRERIIEEKDRFLSHFNSLREFWRTDNDDNTGSRFVMHDRKRIKLDLYGNDAKLQHDRLLEVRGLSHQALISLLKTHITWINQVESEEPNGSVEIIPSQLLSIIAMLDDHLLMHEDVAVIRDLSKACLSRATLTDNSDDAIWWLNIALSLAHNYRQNDILEHILN